MLNPSNTFALDVNGLQDLRQQAKGRPDVAARAVANEFEALFLNMVFKQMRESAFNDELDGGQTMQHYTELLDRQMSQHLAGKLKLTEPLLKQLGVAPPDPAAGATPSTAAATGGKAAEHPLAALAAPAVAHNPFRRSVPGTPDAAASPAGVGTGGFVGRVWDGAVAAADNLGLPPHFLVGHAALESGWGRHEPHAGDGQPSHNLFGIKADPGWKGAVVEAETTEYIDGRAERRVERFRAYDSYEDSFRDYAAFLQDNPRYAGVFEAQDAQSFARGLAQAGYATDPSYAAKLTRVIEGRALRLALVESGGT